MGQKQGIQSKAHTPQLTSYFGTHAEYLINEEQNGVAASLCGTRSEW